MPELVQPQSPSVATVSEQLGWSCESGWYEFVIREELKKPYFQELIKKLLLENKLLVFPPPNLVFNWTILCPFDRAKVVIIGQDPYHDSGQAHGLAFSVPKTLHPIPPSLRNIYKELEGDISGFVAPKHGDLSGWCNQGVVLLNATLTVRAHEPASHSKYGWQKFTNAVIGSLCQNTRSPLVFLLWGKSAAQAESIIAHNRHGLPTLILIAAHPSPLSAARGFFGCKHFSRANSFLQQHGLEPICW